MWGFKGFNDAFFNNSCVFRSSYGSDCGTFAGWGVHDNKVYSQSGTAKICGMNFEQWLASGKSHDKGSSIARWPTDAELIAMGKAVLGMRGSSHFTDMVL